MNSNIFFATSVPKKNPSISTEVNIQNEKDYYVNNAVIISYDNLKSKTDQIL